MGDTVIVPGFVGFGDNSRIVILRFAETLPDDLYRVEVMGADLPAENLVSIRNTAGDRLTPRLAGTDRDVFNFRLQLGAQVVAVVLSQSIAGPMARSIPSWIRFAFTSTTTISTRHRPATPTSIN